MYVSSQIAHKQLAYKQLINGNKNTSQKIMVNICNLYKLKNYNTKNGKVK